jgi:excisionase family DNA binding protein
VLDQTNRRLSTKEAAEYLGLSSFTIRRYVAGGRLRGYQPGPFQGYTFDRAELDRFLAEDKPANVAVPTNQLIGELVGRAPKLSAEQRDRLAAILRRTHATSDDDDPAVA